MAANSAWLTLVRSAALGWVPTTGSSLPKLAAPEQLTKSSVSSSSTVIINVSGVRFYTHRWQLEKHPFTLLGSLEKEFFWDAEREEYFFTRDPDIFRYILGYYQTGRLHFPRDACVSAYEEELAYFGLSSDYVDECCYEDFKDKQRDNKDRIQADRPIQAPAEAPKTFRGKVNEVFQNPESGILARAIYYIGGFFIAVSVFASIIETIPFGHVEESNQVVSLGDYYHYIFSVVDTTVSGL